MLSQFKIGHYTNKQAGSGLTVILPPPDNIASACARGASPGTRELSLLEPGKKIKEIHALLLTGGSAFGLGAAQGIIETLSAVNIGHFTEYGVVPIVPAAVIFDKNIGANNFYPGPQEAANAVKSAVYNNRQTGSIGVGTGATLGKWNGINSAMKGGLGLAEIEHGAIKVTALTVVNAVGDILDMNNDILAGAISADGKFIAGSGRAARRSSPKVGLAENTVLTVVMTNARINKLQAFFIAERAHFGIARRIEPSHTSYDGDVSFVLSSPEVECNIDILAGMAVEVVEYSIIKGINKAEGLFGVKSRNDIGNYLK